jgi:hypothetical protein
VRKIEVEAVGVAILINRSMRVATSHLRAMRVLQMESHRAPPVQPDQQELGSRAAGQLREGAEVHPHNHDHYRLESYGTPGHGNIPHRRQSFKTRTRATIHPTETRPAKMELHHLPADVKLFLGDA